MSTRTATMLSGLVRDTGLLGAPTAAEPVRAAVPAAPRVPAAVLAHLDRLAGPHAALLGPFTCPASRLDDLLAVRGGPGLPFVLVMDTGAADVARAVDRALAGGAVLAGVELPTRPDDDQGPRAAKAVRALAALPAGVPGWVEVHPSRGWRDALGLLAARGRGARLRAGGGPAEVRPSADELAGLVRGCLREGVPFTCAPGGHRVVPDGGTPGRPVHHGLLNLVLAVCRELAGGAAGDLAAVLAVRDSADLLAELAETDAADLARARRRLQTVGCDDVAGTLLDLANLGLARKTA
jgi:hypothetical protein